MKKAKIKDDNGNLIEVDIVKFKKHLDQYHSTGSSLHISLQKIQTFKEKGILKINGKSKTKRFNIIFWLDYLRFSCTLFIFRF